jgi:catechol 2,3-dioxygenase-like lactoylglutathione lyase family enzyme
MITGLAGTAIFSPDATKLVPFYRDTLGIPVVREMDGITFFGEQLLVGSHSELSGPAREPQRQIPSLQTNDIRGDFDRLKAKGVEFLGEPEGIGPVLVVTLRDPDGNLVNLVEFVEGGHS